MSSSADFLCHDDLFFLLPSLRHFSWKGARFAHNFLKVPWGLESGRFLHMDIRGKVHS